MLVYTCMTIVATIVLYVHVHVIFCEAKNFFFQKQGIVYMYILSEVAKVQGSSIIINICSSCSVIVYMYALTIIVQWNL